MCTVTSLVGIVPSSPLGSPLTSLASPSPWIGYRGISRLDCVQYPASSAPDIAMDGVRWWWHNTNISFIAVLTSEGMWLIKHGSNHSWDIPCGTNLDPERLHELGRNLILEYSQ